MREVTLVYPHQLFKRSPAIQKGRKILLIEEPLILAHNPIHRQKLVFHKLSFDAYEEQLKKSGYEVARLAIEHYAKTIDIFTYLKKEGIQVIHVVDTTDFYLEQTIKKSQITRMWYESPIFILSKEDAVSRYTSSRKNMARFYKKLREDKNILLNEDGSPKDGKWSYDEENRKKLPENIQLPKDISFDLHFDHKEIQKWLESVHAEQYGEIGCWLPCTHKEAEAFLQTFLSQRFVHFGAYEDALSTHGVRLFHSTLSPLINVGLLEPKQIIDAAIHYANTHEVPINSLEGFIRQILGWREFIRAAYECDHIAMRTRNFWKHTSNLPISFWTGNTGILPVDMAIKKALRFGYNHHIERLMVMGNFMLLCRIHPDEVYRWFMAMYLDAYDWVMVPNVYGMSQFADGGLFATKPYISGSNYIKKMSNYPDGAWEETWTALYWHFISYHYDFFAGNHRLSMMPRLFDLMVDEKKKKYLQIAEKYLAALTL